MKIVTCYSGVESLVAKEVSGKKVYPGRVKFSQAKNIKSGINVYNLIANFKFKNFTDLLEKLKKVKISTKSTFKIECSRTGNHEFKSMTLAIEFSKFLRSKNYKIDYKNYKETLYIDITDNQCFIGFLLEKNLNKRPYRIKRNKMGIDCSLAFCLIKLLQPLKNKVFYNFNCKDSVLGIEAALQNLQVYCFDPNPNNIRNSKINAKMAKVDINFKEITSCDYLATYFPAPSKKISNNLALRLLNKLTQIHFKKAILISNSNWLKNNLKNYKVKEIKVSHKGSKFFIYLLQT